MDDKVPENILDVIAKTNSDHLSSNMVTLEGRTLAQESAIRLRISEREHGEIMIFLKRNMGGK